MEDAFVEHIRFDQYARVLGESAREKEPGCSWYAAADFACVGCVILDADQETWRYTLHRNAGERWVKSRESGFESFDEAERGRISAMRESCGRRPVTTYAVAPRLRFGKKAKDSSAVGEEDLDGGALPPQIRRRIRCSTSTRPANRE